MIPSYIAIIRNALKANKSKTTVTPSKNLFYFLNILKEHKYISGYSQSKNKKIEVYFGYSSGKPCILNLIYFKKRTYFSLQDLWKFNSDLGLIILSTSKGLYTHKEALKKGIGGQAYAYVF